MDISRKLPNPLPEGWVEVDTELRLMMAKYGPELVFECSNSILHEIVDSHATKALKPLFEQFSGVTRIFVSYGPYVEGGTNFYIFVETESEYTEEEAVHEAFRKIVGELRESIEDKSSVFGDYSMEDFFRSIGDRPYSIIDRTTA